MLRKIEIQNFKSVEHLELEIGRFNVFIGENGCGKTNILEAVAFASLGKSINLNNPVLKGIRNAEPASFRSGFNPKNVDKNIHISIVIEDGTKMSFDFSNSNEPYSKWKVSTSVSNADVNNADTNDDKASVAADKVLSQLKQELPNNGISKNEYVSSLQSILKKIDAALEELGVPISFMIYAPENFFLRNYHVDTPYTQPLGAKGEGLLKLIKVVREEKPEEYNEIIEKLRLIDWFADMQISEGHLSGVEFKIADRFLEDGIGDFDINNANEGFFLLLFYITLFVSNYTPTIFAIDNIDTALNPKLCTKLIEILVQLSEKHNKQVLITTQNPAVLDGINLNDPEQRLFAVSRNKLGYTKAVRIEKKPPLEGEKSLKLSEQFLRGYIGGIPKNF